MKQKLAKFVPSKPVPRIVSIKKALIKYEKIIKKQKLIAAETRKNKRSRKNRALRRSLRNLLD
jgi:hypothetical protein